MTSISSLLSQPTRLSPKERVQQELQTEATSGLISSDDQSALSSAIDDIGDSLQAGRSSSASGRPDPSKIKEKIASLIEDQVSAGKLTDDQAKELATVFDNAAPKGKGHHGGPPPGGPPPGGPPPSSSSDASASASSDSSSISDLISSFLTQLQASNQTGYSASGSTTSSSASLLLDVSV